MTLDNFIKWLNEQRKTANVDWNWITAVMANDDESTDKEIMDCFISEGVPCEVAARVVNLRGEFLIHGLYI